MASPSTPNRNRSILAGVLNAVDEVAPSAPSAPAPALSPVAETPSRLGPRLTALGRVTSGEVQEKTFRLVDPARCRIWKDHNRRYDLLDADNCADLLDGLRSQGRQELPAIVRPVTDDPDIDFEVIAGARRHWCVTYLRTVEHREIKYLIDPQDLTDEQAFRIADIENRSRSDLSDYERAVDYLHALDAYYGGQMHRMAERLEKSKSWLSRFLDLGRLPEPVVLAFGDVRLARVNHARVLKPLVEGEGRGRLLAEAERLSAQQAEHRARGLELIDPSKVVRALAKSAAGEAEARIGPESRPVSNGEGKLLFTVTPKRGRTLLIEVPLDGEGSDKELVDAFRREMAKARS